MYEKTVNEQVLNSLYKNAHIAMQSISDLLPETNDKKMCEELKRQYDGYDKIIGEISTHMKDKGMTPKDITPIKKMMLKTSVKMNAAFKNDRSHIAEMMIKGTIMGVTEIYRDLKEYKKSLSPETVELAQKLVNAEEGYEKKLKEYL